VGLLKAEEGTSEIKRDMNTTCTNGSILEEKGENKIMKTRMMRIIHYDYA